MFFLCLSVFLSKPGLIMLLNHYFLVRFCIRAIFSLEVSHSLICCSNLCIIPSKLVLLFFVSFKFFSQMFTLYFSSWYHFSLEIFRKDAVLLKS